VYTDIAKQYLARQEVRILHYAGLAVRYAALPQDSHSSNFDFLSWEPDWGARQLIKFGGGVKQIFTAGFGIKTLIRVKEHNSCINVSKAFIDVIEVGRNLSIEGHGSSPLDFSFEPSRKSILGLREFFDTHKTSERYSTGETSLTAFARTAVADLAPTRFQLFKSLLKDPKTPRSWLTYDSYSRRSTSKWTACSILARRLCFLGLDPWSRIIDKRLFT